MYEEEIINLTDTTPPYTSYYALGGKLVGMRRANQGAANGQYRILNSPLVYVDPTGHCPSDSSQASKDCYAAADELNAYGILATWGCTDKQGNNMGCREFTVEDLRLVLTAIQDLMRHMGLDPQTRNSSGTCLV